MANVLYIHWHELEAAKRAAALRQDGHTVRCHWARGGVTLGDELPDRVVISLDRLPSHGREVARWFRQARKRQHVPLIFTGGEAEKVAALRAEFPTAVFCSEADLATILIASSEPRSAL